ncbi:16150_t:CDS:2 [Acaulospora colombiana]|uniref:16150_t:CDS:1 n=1 Tax=Acaulospora colombiana TaxID=27376 RepID=A0ACA9LSH8_9GLOM|nr:16150_t:CDS:2 [Acaulospora colombiana]
MKILSDTSDTGDRGSDGEPFQIIIQVDDDAQTEQSSSELASLDIHPVSEEDVDVSSKQIQKSVYSILRLFDKCKLTIGDIFLKGKLQEIRIQDGNFYFDTLQSLKHAEQLVPHAEKVVKFINDLKLQPFTVAEIFNLMAISEELIGSSKKQKELIVELIKRYEDSLKSLRGIFENIKMRKGNISKEKDLIPVREVEIKRIHREFKKCDREAQMYCSYLKGFFICFVIVYLYAESYRSKANDYQREMNRLKQEMERDKLVIESANDEDTKLVELYLANTICQIPSVLKYWKEHKDNLEELSHVENFGKENLNDKWTEIKKSCEDYVRFVSDILDRSGEINWG